METPRLNDVQLVSKVSTWVIETSFLVHFGNLFHVLLTQREVGLYILFDLPLDLAFGND